MKIIALVFTLLVSTQFVHAGSAELADKAVKSNSELVESMLIAEKYIASENNTCIDDYELYRRQAARKAGWGVPVGAAGVAGTTLLGMGVFGLIFDTTGPFGGLVYLAGGVYTFIPAAATFLALETIFIVNYIKANKQMKVLAQARSFHNGEKQKTRTFRKFVSKFLRKYSLHGKGITEDKVAELLVEADENGTLCDASLVSERRKRKFERKGKLKFRLANKKEMMSYLYNNL